MRGHRFSFSFSFLVTLLDRGQEAAEYLCFSFASSFPFLSIEFVYRFGFLFVCYYFFLFWRLLRPSRVVSFTNVYGSWRDSCSFFSFSVYMSELLSPFGAATPFPQHTALSSFLSLPLSCSSLKHTHAHTPAQSGMRMQLTA